MVPILIVGCSSQSFPLLLLLRLTLSPDILVGGDVMQVDVDMEDAEVEQQSSSQHGHQSCNRGHNEEQDRGDRKKKEVETANWQRNQTIAKTWIVN